MPVEIAPGLFAETVGEIIENGTNDPGAPKAPFVPARLPASPPLPEPGIYFGMDDETYHALPALSASGVKLMAASSMLFWARTSWLNPEREEQVAEAEKDKDHLPIGKAYHVRILEGKAAFDSRFVAKPDKPDFGEDVIQGTDAIKAAIMRLEETPYTRVATGETVPVPKKPGETKPVTRAAVKADWIEQLQALDPEARIYEVLMIDFEKGFEAEHVGKAQLPAKVVRRIEIAAAMIERDPGIGPQVKGGEAEVTLICYDPATGVPLKARVDKMKFTKKIDLKTLANQRERSIREAIRWEIAGYKYLVQPVFYDYVSEIVRGLVREHGASVVHSWEMRNDPGESTSAWRDEEARWKEEHGDRVAFALKWASHRTGDDFGWLFQQKGMAPVSRLIWCPRRGIKRAIVEDIVGREIRRFRELSDGFGVDPWLDIADPEQFADEDLPESSVEI